MRSFLVCFAVKEEARGYRPPPDGRCLVTGIGRERARKSLEAWLDRERPEYVVTSGCAGALQPRLKLGDVLGDFDGAFPFRAELLTAGVRPGRFHCSDSVLTTATAKQACASQSGADAVEMESAALRQLCAQRGIPSATIRVVLDECDEDLPLEFNRFLTPEGKLRFGQLGLALARSPRLIPPLFKLGQNMKFAARKLGLALSVLR